MTYLIVNKNKVQEIKNVAKLEETFFDWIFIKTDGTKEVFPKINVDIL